MSYEGKIYRPWMEADSELIQVTLGCSVNTCTSCSMFRDKSFRRKPLEEIFADIDMLRRYRGRVESIFLIDGNVMVLKTELLLKVIARIRETFPELKNLAMYSGLNDLRRKSVEELKQICRIRRCFRASFAINFNEPARMWFRRRPNRLNTNT